MRLRAESDSLLLRLLLALGVLLCLASPVFPQAPVQSFFVPVPAVEVQTWAEALQPAVDNDVIHSVISITITTDGTVVYYDHWEDLFEFDETSPTQLTTEIWGDSDCGNGFNPNLASCLVPSDDVLGAGDVIALENDVDVTGGTRDPNVILWDGGDYFSASQPLAVTRAAWTGDAPVGAQLGAALEVFDTGQWKTAFEAPVGEDLNGGGIGETFEFVAFSIMAEEDGTGVDIDVNADSIVDTSLFLDRGESVLIEDVLVGGSITSTGGVQVALLTANEDTGYEGRWFSQIPTADWGDEYFSPVGSTVAGDYVHVYLYNPGGAAITIQVHELVAGVPTCTDVVVGSGNTVEYQLDVETPTSAARFLSDGSNCAGSPAAGGSFFAVATIDRNETIHDWGYTLIPTSSLTPAVVVGWAPGSTNLSENVSPIWVTAIDPPGGTTTLYIDFDGDPTTGALTDPYGNNYDINCTANLLESVRIFDGGGAGTGCRVDGDFDQTGMRIYTVDGTSIAAAWGQDPQFASSSQPQQLDMGTTVVPFSSLMATKTGALASDDNGNGQLDPGETLLYTIRVVNNGLIPITDIELVDTLDPNTTYELNTTQVDGSPISDDVPVLPGDTEFPLDADPSHPSGYLLVGLPDYLDPGEEILVTFEVRVVDPFPPTATEIINTLLVRSDSETFVDTEFNPVPRMDVEKTSNVTEVCPGDPVTYTIEVTNLSGVTLTELRVFDPLPANTTYVAESTLVVGQTVDRQVRDEFGSVSFSNNDGKDNWSTPWIEGGDNCGLTQCVPGPGAGQVFITTPGGQLSLDDQPNTGGQPSAAREVSLAGATVALFSFDWETTGGVDSSDAVTVEVSSNGGGSYTTLEVMNGIVGAQTGSRTYDISPFIASNTRIRFRITNFYGGSNEFFRVDNVDVRTSRSYRDEFGAANYNNSDGTLDWTGNSWFETNDDGSPSGGSIDIVGGELHLEGSGGNPLRQITRQVDLSGAVSALWTFDWRCAGDMEAAQDFVLIEVSDDGGGSWTTLQVKEGEVDMCLPPGNADSGSETFDLTPFMAVDTQIRFGFTISATSEDFYIDNVEILASTAVASIKDNVPLGANPDLVDGVPPDLVLPADGFALAPGGTLTVTYQVLADNPLDPSDSPITNSVTVSARETPNAEASVSDPLTFGSHGDTVWEDLDENGVQNGFEPGIPNVTVNLLAAGCVGGPLASAVTDASGNYTFPDLSPIGYCVQVDETTLPANLTEHTTMNNPLDLPAATLASCADHQDADFGYNDPATTPVTLSSFRATPGGIGTRIEWTTATETGNVGFNLYALTSSGWEKVNREVVPSKVVDSVEPVFYQHEVAESGAEWFYLEDLDVRGESELRGPFALDQHYGARDVQPRRIDWASIRAKRATGTKSALAATSTRSATAFAASDPVTVTRSSRRRGRRQVGSVDLHVDRDGIQRVTYEQLRDAGLDLAGVPARQLRLSNRGKSVPLYVPGGSRTRFGPGRYLEFVGEALDTLYTGTNVYRVGTRGPRRSRVRTDRTPASPFAAAADHYLETVEVDRERDYAFGAPNGDPWYDTRMLAFENKPKEFSFDVLIDAIAAGGDSATLRVDTWGMTSWPQADDHHLEVFFNGASLADDRFDGQVSHVVEQVLPSGLLSEGLNQLELGVPGDTGVLWDIIVLDRFSVTYPRRFVAREGRLSFTAAGSSFRVEGLSSPDVVVYRKTDRGVARLKGVVVQPFGGGYQAAFPGTGSEATYFVSTTAAIHQPAATATRARLSRLTRGRARYLVISHPDFLSGLDPLVDRRRRDGLSVKVVNVEDVYARYSHGIFDPEAIRTYIRQAANKLRTRYVLLVGGDSYDYRDYLGIGAISFIPSLYTATDHIVRFTPADPLYADTDGDLVADLALGRLPVRTPAELDSIIAKTLRYERIGYPLSAVFAADADTGSGMSFSHASNELIAGLPGGWTVDRAYIDTLDVPGAREVLIGNINAGVGLTSFFGHSGPAVWSFQGLFETADAEALENAGLPTVVTQWGCWNTYYVSPYSDSMAHRLLLSGDRGAAAVFGASTLTQSASDSALGVQFMPRLATAGLTVGDALRDAKQALAQTQPHRLDVLVGWTLLGDPALKLRPAR